MTTQPTQNELPAEVREAIQVAAVFSTGADSMMPASLRKLTDDLCSALAPLWPKPTQPSKAEVVHELTARYGPLEKTAPDRAKVAEEICAATLPTSQIKSHWWQMHGDCIAAILEKHYGPMERELKCLKEVNEHRIRVGNEQQERAEKAEAELAKWTQGYDLSLPDLYEKAKAERDQAGCVSVRKQEIADLRAQLAAAQQDKERLKKDRDGFKNESESHFAGLSRWQKECDDLRAQLAAAQETLEKARSVAYAAPELNMCNYCHEQVSELNVAMCEVFTLLDAAREGGAK